MKARMVAVEKCMVGFVVEDDILARCWLRSG